MVGELFGGISVVVTVKAVNLVAKELHWYIQQEHSLFTV